jgi:excisionase family DNA binding protein
MKIRHTYSVKEVAAILGVTSTTVYRLIARRKLKALAGIRHKRIPDSEVDRFLDGSGGNVQ